MRNKYNTPLRSVDNKHWRKKLVFSSFPRCECYASVDIFVYVDVAFYADDSLFRCAHEKTDIVNSACSNFPQPNHFWLNIQLCVFRCHAAYFIKKSTSTTLARVFALIRTSLHALYEVLFKFYYSLSRMLLRNICMQNVHIDRKHPDECRSQSSYQTINSYAKHFYEMHHRKLWMGFSFRTGWGCGCGWEWKTNLLWQQLKIGELLAIYFNDIHYET